MLKDLEATGQALLQAAEALELQTSRHVPDAVPLGNARLGICRAESRRIQLLEQTIYPALLERCTESEAKSLIALRTSGRELRSRSSQFVSRWGTDAVHVNWDTYRSGSALLQAELRRQLAAEQAMLNPIASRLYLYPGSGIVASAA